MKLKHSQEKEAKKDAGILPAMQKYDSCLFQPMGITIEEKEHVNKGHPITPREGSDLELVRKRIKHFDRALSQPLTWVDDNPNSILALAHQKQI